MKIIYIAADSSLPRDRLCKLVADFTVDAFDPNCMDGFFFAPQIHDKNQPESENPERDFRNSGMMSVLRKFNEAWLIGPNVPDAEFDSNFKLELRMIKQSAMPFRRFKMADTIQAPQTPQVPGAVSHDAVTVPEINQDSRIIPVYEYIKPGTNTCTISAALQLEDGRIADLPSPGNFKSTAGCFENAADLHLDIIDDYIRALKRYRDRILSTSEVFRSAVEKPNKI